MGSEMCIRDSVEVTEVAGVGLSGVPDRQHLGRLDPVNPDRGEQCVGRVGHVAVVATAAGRASAVMGVLGQPLAGELGVTLQAGPVASHLDRQLVVGVAVVHRVAGQALHFSLRVALGGDLSEKLATAQAARTVVPVEVGSLAAHFLVHGVVEADHLSLIHI